MICLLDHRGYRLGVLGLPRVAVQGHHARLRVALSCLGRLLEGDLLSAVASELARFRWGGCLCSSLCLITCFHRIRKVKI